VGHPHGASLPSWPTLAYRKRFSGLRGPSGAQPARELSTSGRVPSNRRPATECPSWRQLLYQLGHPVADEHVLRGAAMLPAGEEAAEATEVGVRNRGPLPA